MKNQPYDAAKEALSQFLSRVLVNKNFSLKGELLASKPCCSGYLYFDRAWSMALSKIAQAFLISSMFIMSGGASLKLF